ncbi:MAG: hypothetical protein WD049_07615 [Candidatus Paceibacterota bacterium]
MNAKRVHAIEGTRYDKWDAHLRLQIAIVDTLAKAEKPLSKIEVTEKLGKHPVNTPIGGLTRLLEKQGLVICTRDGSRLFYSLTQAGYEAAIDDTRIGKPPLGSTIVSEAATVVKKAPTLVEAKEKPIAPRQDKTVKPRVESADPIPKWLLMFPEGGIRALFAHLATHGVLTESEAATLLGGHRELRRFARQFDDLKPNAPFRVRIETVAGVKRYVREGSL